MGWKSCCQVILSILGRPAATSLVPYSRHRSCLDQLATELKNCQLPPAVCQVWSLFLIYTDLQQSRKRCDRQQPGSVYMLACQWSQAVFIAAWPWSSPTDCGRMLALAGTSCVSLAHCMGVSFPGWICDYWLITQAGESLCAPLGRSPLV